MNISPRPIILVLCFSAVFAHAQVPQLLEYDGFLSGNITGDRTVGVRLYNASTNGTLLYKETIGKVKITQGQFYFQYGQNGTQGNGTSPTAISAVLTGKQNWLAITINGTEQVPRERLLSVPFALRSADVQKTNEDLKTVLNAVGKIVVAFGGNSSDLLTNPTGTIAKIEKQAKDFESKIKSLSANITDLASLQSNLILTGILPIFEPNVIVTYMDHMASLHFKSF